MAAKATMAITITLAMMINVVVPIRIYPNFLANPRVECGVQQSQELSREDDPSSKGLMSVLFRTLQWFTSPKGQKYNKNGTGERRQDTLDRHKTCEVVHSFVKMVRPRSSFLW
jgi:hypothetical protein